MKPVTTEERLQRLEDGIKTIITLLSSMQHRQPADRLLKDVEVAKILSVTRDTVWKQSRAGIIPPAVRHGKGAVRWRESEINAYIANLEHINTKGGKP